MDVFDLVWNLSQDKAIQELKAARSKHLGEDGSTLKRLQEENAALRLRLSLLIRLLIERGVITGEEYMALVEGTTAKLAETQQAEAKQRAARAARVQKAGRQE